MMNERETLPPSTPYPPPPTEQDAGALSHFEDRVDRVRMQLDALVEHASLTNQRVFAESACPSSGAGSVAEKHEAALVRLNHSLTAVEDLVPLLGAEIQFLTSRL